MLNQFEDMIIDNLVTKLNAKGVNVDADTVKRALENSPQLVVQIEGILTSNSQDRVQKVIALITQNAGTGTTTTTTGTTSGTTTGGTTGTTTAGTRTTTTTGAGTTTTTGTKK